MERFRGDSLDERAGNLLKQMQNVINGNNCVASDLKAKHWEESRAEFEVVINWRYEYQESYTTEIGKDQSAPKNFQFDKSLFREEINKNGEIATTDPSIRAPLLEEMNSAQSSHVLTLASESKLLKEFERISFYEECNECSGKGECSCSACFGRGYSSCGGCSGSGIIWDSRRVSDGRGGLYNESYTRSCHSCSGSGRTGCSSCGSSGAQSCSSCNGTGYFTNICDGKAVAIPTIEISIDAVAHQLDALEEWANREPLSLLGTLIPFKISKIESGLSDQYLCKGASSVITLECELKNRTYSVGGLGTIPYAFNRPPLFDHLFEKKLNQLRRRSVGETLSLGADEARDFFNRSQSNTVLDQSLKRLAKLESDDNEEAGREIIFTSCEGYITKDSAQLLYRGLKETINQVSPPYSLGGWLGAMFLSYYFLFFSVQYQFEIGEGGIFKNILHLLFAVFMIAISLKIVGLFLVTPLSQIVSLIRRRKIPKEYRQPLDNSKMRRLFVTLGLWSTTIAAIVGMLAQKGLIPQWNGAPLAWVIELLEYLLLKVEGLI